MRFNLLNRKVHYWATAFLALPMLVVIGSGLLLWLSRLWMFLVPLAAKRRRRRMAAETAVSLPRAA